MADSYGRRLLVRMPTGLTRFLGYRAENPQPTPTCALYLWSSVGAFCGTAILQTIFGHTAYFSGRHVPPIIASFGASAILCYGSIDVPLAQPRSLVGGHFLSAFIGICVTKIFDVSFDDDSNQLQWVAGSVAVAVALVAMQATKTTHPPAGATALLPCVDLAVWAIHWYYLPVVLLSSVIILVTALGFNNIQRHYPKFWLTPTKPPPPANNGIPLSAMRQSNEQSASKARFTSAQTISTMVDPEPGPSSPNRRPMNAVSVV